MAVLILLGLDVLEEDTEAWTESCCGLYQNEKAMYWIKLVVNCFVPFLLRCMPSALYGLELVQKESEFETKSYPGAEQKFFNQW